MMPPAFWRQLRRALLRYARTLDGYALQAKAGDKALRAAAWAATHSHAYRTLVLEAGLDPAGIGTRHQLNVLPILTKTNTFERFGLEALMRPVPVRDLADVLTSSGRGGQHFGFRLSDRAQHEGSWFDIDLGLQDIFQIDERPTLVVNCLPMGVMFRSRATAVANLSVREDMACSILKSVGPRFKQTVLCTDPLFIRQILREGERRGVDWPSINTSVIIGEEVLVEPQRDFIAKEMGIALDDPQQHRLIGSSFGIGEIGLNLLFETRETIAIRRLEFKRRATSASAASQWRGTPSLFCVNPMRCHLSVLNPDHEGYGELCFTLLGRNEIIPLPRYATGDMGRIIPKDEAQALADAAGVKLPWLPMVSVLGRIKDQPNQLPSAERLKEALYVDHIAARELTGAFQLKPAVTGAPVLTVQAQASMGADLVPLQSRLRDVLSAQIAMPMEVQVRAVDDVPWRPAMDYERKFPYLPG